MARVGIRAADQTDPRCRLFYAEWEFRRCDHGRAWLHATEYAARLRAVESFQRRDPRRSTTGVWRRRVSPFPLNELRQLPP